MLEKIWFFGSLEILLKGNYRIIVRDNSTGKKYTNIWGKMFNKRIIVDFTHPLPVLPILIPPPNVKISYVIGCFCKLRFTFWFFVTFCVFSYFLVIWVERGGIVRWLAIRESQKSLSMGKLPYPRQNWRLKVRKKTKSQGFCGGTGRRGRSATAKSPGFHIFLRILTPQFCGRHGDFPGG